MHRLSKHLAITIALLSILCAAARADSPAAPAPLLVPYQPDATKWVAPTGPAPAATQSQAALIGVLKSGASLEQKAAACRQLAWIGNRDAVPVLANLLGDEKLSHMARYALERIPDPTVDEALRAAVPKVHGKLLAGVLSSLGARRDKNAVDLLAEKIKDSDLDVARAAVFALGGIANAQSAAALEKALPSSPDSVRSVIWDAILRCAERRIAEKNPSAALAEYILLIAEEPSMPIRVAAYRGAILEGQRGLLLPQLLASDDRPLFNLALQLAREIPPGNATATYTSALATLPAEKKALVIEALGVRGDKSAVPEIRAAAKDRDLAVRIAAVRSLASLGDSTSAALILDATLAPEKALSDAAIAAVLKMPAGDVDIRLMSMANSGDHRKQIVGFECLARRHNDTATKILLAIAENNEEPEVRRAAMKALTQTAGAADLPGALKIVSHAASRDQLPPSAEALVIGICNSATDKEACTAKVVAAMTAAKPEQKAIFLDILSGVGGANGLQAVRDSISKGDAGLRNAALATLCSWPDQAAAPDLLGIARDASQPNYKTRALRGYLRLALDVDLPGDKRLEMATAASPLIQRDEERKLVLRVLGRIQSPKALAMVEPFLDLPAVKANAAAAAIAVATQLARDPDAGKFAAAIAAAMEKVKHADPGPDLIKKASDIEERVRPLLHK